MKSSAIKRTAPSEIDAARPRPTPSAVETKFEPRNARHPSSLQEYGDPWGRMFTEEEVSGLLRVSLSQLRKWRMKKNRHNAQGPPFRKIGRLVRYPGRGLRDYINGDQDSSE